MTREEAISIMNVIVHMLEPQYDTDRIEEALEMAIQALEQQQSRDMEEIKEIMECDTDAETKCKMISNILTAKPHYFEKQEPKYCDRDICVKNEYNGISCDECEVTKSQELKTGHWIRVDDTKVKCSNCDIIHLIAQYPNGVINYCPNCGRRMTAAESET